MVLTFELWFSFRKPSGSKYPNLESRCTRLRILHPRWFLGPYTVMLGTWTLRGLAGKQVMTLTPIDQLICSRVCSTVGDRVSFSTTKMVCRFAAAGGGED